MDEAGNHVSIEPVGEHKQVLGDAMRNATEQLKRTALFRTEEVTCSRQLRQQGPHRIFLRRDAASVPGMIPFSQIVQGRTGILRSLGKRRPERRNFFVRSRR